MRFWDGYYKRFRDLELNEFVSRLAGSVDVEVGVNLEDIKELTEEQAKNVMGEIRNKSDLLLALAFSEIKEVRQTYRPKN